jgi:hypothetical protein
MKRHTTIALVAALLVAHAAAVRAQETHYERPRPWVGVELAGSAGIANARGGAAIRFEPGWILGGGFLANAVIGPYLREPREWMFGGRLGYDVGLIFGQHFYLGAEATTADDRFWIGPTAMLDAGPLHAIARASFSLAEPIADRFDLGIGVELGELILWARAGNPDPPPPFVADPAVPAQSMRLDLAGSSVKADPRAAAQQIRIFREAMRNRCGATDAGNEESDNAAFEQSMLAFLTTLGTVALPTESSDAPTVLTAAYDAPEIDVKQEVIDARRDIPCTDQRTVRQAAIRRLKRIEREGGVDDGTTRPDEIPCGYCVAIRRGPVWLILHSNTDGTTYPAMITVICAG